MFENNVRFVSDKERDKFDPDWTGVIRVKVKPLPRDDSPCLICGEVVQLRYVYKAGRKVYVDPLHIHEVKHV